VIEVGWLVGPTLIGQTGQLLELPLSHNVFVLFLERRRLLADISKPLMPLRGDLDIGVVSTPVVFDYAPVSVAVYGILKLPKGIPR